MYNKQKYKVQIIKKVNTILIIIILIYNKIIIYSLIIKK
jgi:hypothetical protein